MICFRDQAWKDYLYWQQTDKSITDEHRLVYTFSNDELIIVQCRYHYN